MVRFFLYKYNLLALLAACIATFVSCKSGFEDVLPPANKQVYSISGRILKNGRPLAGIQITDGHQFVRTDTAGLYVISDVARGTYLIIPNDSGYRFVPNHIAATIHDSSLLNIDFEAYNYFSVEMVSLPGGIFQMGADNGNSNEKPAHWVSLSPFLIGKYEITQKEWQQIMQTNPSIFIGSDYPVQKVSWYDAIAFCNELSKVEGLDPAYTIAGADVQCNFTSNGYRLPTEAEWEYACRGGTTTDRYSGNVSSTVQGKNFFEPNLDSIAWYKYNSDSSAHQVGLKRPNSFGIFDMQGNVTEWCWNYWANGYPTTLETDPTGPSTGTARALRGGSWFDVPWEVRSAFHRSYSPNSRFSGVGFRVARSRL